MTEIETLARAIASEIVNQTIWENYRFYLLVIAISLVSGALVAFTAPYLKRRGETFATKADFDEIIRQLKDTTTLTESIKSYIKAKFDEEHSVRALTREKFEALFEQTFELELWLEHARSQALVCNIPDVNGSPMAKIEMYQAVYFKEIEVEVHVLNIAVLEMIRWILKLAKDAIRAKAEGSLINMEMDTFGGLQEAVSAALSVLRADLIKKYGSKVGL